MTTEIKKTIPIAARERGPGPGRYKLPSTCGYHQHDYTKYMRPSYSFGGRLSDFNPECSPGPVYFINSRVTRHGTDGTPSYSMLGRQREPVSFKTPSPGAYKPEKVHPQGERHAPIFSMATRTRIRKRDQNPAPNRYALPKMLGSFQPNKFSYPSYSMSLRTNVGSYAEDLSKTPGPGQYNAVEPNKIRTRGAQYSLQETYGSPVRASYGSPVMNSNGRSYMPGDNTVKPGPGAHKPEAVHINKRSAPTYSLGIRHSEFVTPLLIQLN